MKKQLRIYFTDFWAGFEQTDNLFYRLLQRHYDVVIDSKGPDIVLYNGGWGGEEHRKFRCNKVFYTGECQAPDFQRANVALSFEPSTATNLYFPLWLLNYEIDRFQPQLTADVDRALRGKSAWCLFLVSNPQCQERIDFFHELSKRRHVDSPGKVCNNMARISVGDARDPASQVPDAMQNWHEAKRRFLPRYKFNIAFENQSSPGYITEKVLDPLYYGVVPIYWGARDIGNVLNPKAIINAHDFRSHAALADYVMQVDADDELYKSYLREPMFRENRIPEFLIADFLAARLAELVEVALKSPKIGETVGGTIERGARSVLRRAKGLTSRLLSTK